MMMMMMSDIVEYDIIAVRYDIVEYDIIAVRYDIEPPVQAFIYILLSKF